MLLKKAQKDHRSSAPHPIPSPKDTLKTTRSHPNPPPHYPSKYYILFTLPLFFLPLILSAIPIPYHLPSRQPKPLSFITVPPSPPCLTSYTPPSSSSVTTGFAVVTSGPTPTNQGYVPRRRFQQTQFRQALRTWAGTEGPPYDDPPIISGHRGAGVVCSKTVYPGALRLPCSTIDADDFPFVDMDGREDVGEDKGVAECKPPFWITGAGGVVNGSSVYMPLFEMLGAEGLVLVLRSAVSRLSAFRIKFSSFWRTGGVGIM
ncbi:hypothetical protein JMJ35_007428 [Cladonia borealis]|uniref:Uncharacterized protein n=1 Tax=Cladonia borealis TaxID=184061 RepID=A0AA39QY12_9LECA|nr:hypothetical protein JMJ35_007428 [Cladonia borealis]